MQPRGGQVAALARNLDRAQSVGQTAGVEEPEEQEHAGAQAQRNAGGDVFGYRGGGRAAQGVQNS